MPHISIDIDLLAADGPGAVEVVIQRSQSQTQTGRSDAHVRAGYEPVNLCADLVDELAAERHLYCAGVVEDRGEVTRVPPVMTRLRVCGWLGRDAEVQR